jgi:hypothetical protein
MIHIYLIIVVLSQRILILFILNPTFQLHTNNILRIDRAALYKEYHGL